MHGPMGKGESAMKRTLKHDDVVFMFSASDPSAYAKYGATVIAWGGPHSLKDTGRLKEMGIHTVSSIACRPPAPTTCMPIRTCLKPPCATSMEIRSPYRVLNTMVFKGRHFTTDALTIHLQVFYTEKTVRSDGRQSVGPAY